MGWRCYDEEGNETFRLETGDHEPILEIINALNGRIELKERLKHHESNDQRASI